MISWVVATPVPEQKPKKYFPKALNVLLFVENKQDVFDFAEMFDEPVQFLPVKSLQGKTTYPAREGMDQTVKIYFDTYMEPDTDRRLHKLLRTHVFHYTPDAIFRKLQMGEDKYLLKSRDPENRIVSIKNYEHQKVVAEVLSWNIKQQSEF